MRIVHVSTSDLGGGAQIAAYRLHGALRRLGHDSTMFVGRRTSDDPSVVAFEPRPTFVRRVRRRLRRLVIDRSYARYQATRPGGLMHFADDRAVYAEEILDQLPPCDVINLHFITWFVDYRAFFARVFRHTPIVWTLHDMSALTGGCCYALTCGKYSEQCGACPQLGSHTTVDLSRRVWQRKRAAYSRLRPDALHMVAPSRWMAENIKRSALMRRYPVTVIPYGVDLDEFAPRDRAVARQALGIPQDARVVLTIPYAGRHKGTDLLVQALEGIDETENLWLLSLGGYKPTITPRIRHLHLGFIGSSRLLGLAYNAADIFVIPSRQDNLPNTVLESLACGTPVVGFNVGGIPDMVRPGITGLLVPPEDIAALRAAMVGLLKDREKRDRMAGNCRRVALEEYGLETPAGPYMQLYQSMIANAAPRTLE